MLDCLLPLSGSLSRAILALGVLSTCAACPDAAALIEGSEDRGRADVVVPALGAAGGYRPASERVGTREGTYYLPSDTPAGRRGAERRPEEAPEVEHERPVWGGTSSGSANVADEVSALLENTIGVSVEFQFFGLAPGDPEVAYDLTKVAAIQRASRRAQELVKKLRRFNHLQLKVQVVGRLNVEGVADGLPFARNSKRAKAVEAEYEEEVAKLGVQASATTLNGKLACIRAAGALRQLQKAFAPVTDEMYTVPHEPVEINFVCTETRAVGQKYRGVQGSVEFAISPVLAGEPSALR